MPPPLSAPGVLTGGGTVGFGQFARDDDSFFRKNGQAAYNYTLGTKYAHDLHVGIQRFKDSEDRFQLSAAPDLLDESRLEFERVKAHGVIYQPSLVTGQSLVIMQSAFGDN